MNNQYCIIFVVQRYIGSKLDLAGCCILFIMQTVYV